MAPLHLLRLILLSLISASCTSSASQEAKSSSIPQHYIVYMGASDALQRREINVAAARTANNAEVVADHDHLQMLSSIIPRSESERVKLIYHYKEAFHGFSAMLTKDEASVLSDREEVVSIFPDSKLQLHTTRSWDFLNAESSFKSNDNIMRFRFSPHSGPRDVIIGMIDTGVWPELPSFDDSGLPEVPSRWKGVCMGARDFKNTSCNRKVIGTRYYHNAGGSPRDDVGHGSHTASIAAGAAVGGANYYGLANGTAKGGSPSSRIAAYKVCTKEGCFGSAILKAFDDAIGDGVDLISISIGVSTMFTPDYFNDPIAIGAFHAAQAGVLVVGSAGNEGPAPSTVGNSALWIFTVAASNIDRDFQSTVLLGDGSKFRGSAINFSNLTRSMTYPLAYGKDVAANSTIASVAMNCRPGSLDRGKVAGKIIVCVDNAPFLQRTIKKLVVEDCGAKGMILIDEYEKGIPFDSGAFPFTQVGDADGSHILKYIYSTRNPNATILPSVDVPKSKPAPAVASFSSRGPALFTQNILKPDIMAPGVAILAAMIPNKEAGSSIPVGKKASNFGIKSGTSMSCPHVTGAAALVKSVHHGWTPSMIRSALMTSALTTNNLGKPLTNSSKYPANPHEMGVGELSPLKALNPGLVFKTTTEDYLNSLCYLGYKQSRISSMSKTNFTCPKISSEELVSNINYPSISIGKLDRHGPGITVRRTATNVAPKNAAYHASLDAPKGLEVKVFPPKIAFSKDRKELSFSVSFRGKAAVKGYNFGSVTWTDGLHVVRLVFAVNVF